MTEKITSKFDLICLNLIFYGLLFNFFLLPVFFSSSVQKKKKNRVEDPSTCVQLVELIKFKKCTLQRCRVINTVVFIYFNILISCQGFFIIIKIVFKMKVRAIHTIIGPSCLIKCVIFLYFYKILRFSIIVICNGYSCACFCSYY